MESKNDIDKLFKNKLENREFEIKESFLADLEEKLDAQKPSKRYWGLIFFAFLAVVGVSFLTYYLTTNNADDAVYSQISIEDVRQDLNSETGVHTDVENGLNNENATSEHQKTEASYSLDESNDGINKENQFVESQPEANNVASGNNSRVESSTEKTNSENSSEKSSNNGSVTSKPSSDSGSYKNVGVNSETQNAEETDNSFKPSENENTSEEEISITSNKEKSEQEAKNEGSNKTDFVKDGLSENVSVDVNKDVSTSGTMTESTESDTVKSTEEKSIVELATSIDTVANETVMDTTLLASDSIIEDSLIQEKEITDEVTDTLSEENDVVNELGLTPEDSTKKIKKWTLSLFGGPSLINKKIFGLPTDAYLAKRNDEESGIASMSYGLRVNYNFNEKINISLGANSVTYGEDVNYSTIYNTTSSNSTTSKDSSYLDYEYTAVQDSNGVWDTLVTTITVDTTIIMDTIIFNTDSVNYSGENRFTYVQIPIMFGYKFTFNKLSVNVRLGGSYGILLKNTGSYIDNGVTNIETPNLKKTMINMVASTTISYQMKKMNVFIEPKFRMNSGTIITHPEIKQRYAALGCNFGLSFDF